jgi:putative ABC transport system permease protein
MFGNHFKTAWRHLWRNKAHTSINIAGLSMGMACALLAILFVQDEVSYDRFHENAQRLYRLTTTVVDADNNKRVLGTSGQVQGPAFKAAIPEIEDDVRVFRVRDMNVTGNGKALAFKTLFADPGFFQVLSFPLWHGNAVHALSDPNSIVLSRHSAMMLFGRDDVVGEVIKMEDGGDIKNLLVSGVAKDAPGNSSIQFDAVIPFVNLRAMFTDDNWLNQYLTTLILLKPFANRKEVEQKISSVFASEAKSQLVASGYAARQFQFGLAPITDIHLSPLGISAYGSSEDERGLTDTSSVGYSYVLSGIIAFILLMACVNMINLNMANASRRSTEIGIRKVVGSSRGQIILQFLVEAFLVCIISLVIAVLLGMLLLPVFNRLSGKRILFSDFTQPLFFVYGLLVAVVCVLLSGVYPALRVSLFNPVEALLKRQKLGGKNHIGKALIVGQFALAVGLIMGAFVYFRQMSFVAAKDLGYSPERMIIFRLPPQRINENVVRVLKNELLQYPPVEQVSNEMGIFPDAVMVNGKRIRVKGNMVDAAYLSAMGIGLKEGRNFHESRYFDSVHSVLVNETFIKVAGLKDPLGHQVKGVDDSAARTIIGVVKDYHYASLREAIQPEIITLNTGDMMLVKLRKGKELEGLAAVNKVFRSSFPDHFFEYRFLDDLNASAYETDRRWQEMISYASVMAILICCMGLFGLSVFVAQQRIKEIGIRKALGASVAGITIMLTRDFLKLILLAIVIASTPAYLLTSKWLQGYAYRIDLSWWIFALAGLLTIVIAVITIGFHALRAATANPVQSLRME